MLRIFSVYFTTFCTYRKSFTSMYLSQIFTHRVFGGYYNQRDMLQWFKSRCGFIQYISSKSAKYAIKIFVFRDVKRFYTSNLEFPENDQIDLFYILITISHHLSKKKSLSCIHLNDVKLTTSARSREIKGRFRWKGNSRRFSCLFSGTFFFCF